jgi:DNA repair protein RadC
MNIRLTSEQKIRVLNSEDLFRVMQQILLREDKIGRKQEHFWVVGLNGQDRILNIELVALGKTNIVNVDPVVIYRIALMKDAEKIILVHNHPNGNITPSDSDKRKTDQLNQVGRIHNIRLVDHLIITTKKYFSFEEEGLMTAIRLSKEFIPRYEEEERIRKEALASGRKQRDYEIAIAMMEDGYSHEAIEKYTGLSKEEIEGVK